MLAQAYFSRGNTYTDIQKYEKALEDLTQTIKISTEPKIIALAYARRGETHAHIQQYDEAFSDFAQAIKLQPDLALAYVGRGTVYHTLQQYALALSDYMHAIKLNPDDARSQFNAGAVLCSQGELNKGLPYLEKAKQLGHVRAAQVIPQVKQMLNGR